MQSFSLLKNNNKHLEAGFSFLELLVAVVLISLALTGLVTCWTVIGNVGLHQQRKREAESTMAELLARLKTRRRADLPIGGAFAVDEQTGRPARDNDGNVEFNCSNLYCDRVIELPIQVEGTSAERSVIEWDEALPEGARLRFIRAWQVTDEDEARGWRRLSVLVFPSDSNTPLTQTVAGLVLK